MEKTGKNKLSCVALSLILPGMGQFALNRYWRGSFQAVTAIAAVFWLAAEVIMPFIDFYRSDIASSQLEFQAPQFAAVLCPILLFMAALIWSIADLLTGSEKTSRRNR
ncbi:MAG: hypothetical protein PHV59_00830 [Victivallales bacterium]|nr:hypothetical protein [Victivallales bacterium]